MDPKLVFACIAIIAVGVAIIMYTLLRTPKTPAGIGSVPSIDLGEEPKAEEPDEAEDAAPADEADGEPTEPDGDEEEA